MPYNATAINVMIASPSDVSVERNIIRSTVHEWNAVHSRERGLVLTPIGWESHSFPEIGRPQAVINRQILEQSDLLIAVFWTRLGSPTGEAESGTVEEIEKHIGLGRPAMIYFSNAPVRPDSVDDKQYGALRKFRTEFEKRGLIEVYGSTDEFRLKLSRQLAQTVIKSFGKLFSNENDVSAATPVVKPPHLSEAGRQLLSEIAQDRNGVLMMVATLGGLIVQTNGKQLATAGDPRSEAKWKSAAKELASLELIENQGSKGEIFRLTDRGYAAADELGVSAAVG